MEVTRRAKHLGALISCAGAHVPEIRQRVPKATATAVCLGQRVWKHAVPMSLKVDLCKSMVRAVLTYGLECWALPAGLTRQLEQTQTRALRWLAWAPAHNTLETHAALRARLGVPTIASVGELAGHRLWGTCPLHTSGAPH